MRFANRLHPSTLCLALFVALLLSVSASAGNLTHRVQPGETLWSISHGYGVKVQEVIAVNGIKDPTDVPIGLELRIPGARPARPVAPEVNGNARLQWPLIGVTTSRYGRRRGRMHAGLDIGAPTGTIVVAAAAGKVIRGGDRWGRYGIVVMLQHADGSRTLYAHLARAFVRPGQQVRAGQAVAAVGSTGNATGPHLHFEVWRQGRTVDPESVLPR